MKHRIAIGLAAMALLAAACGDSDEAPPTTAATTTTTPATTVATTTTTPPATTAPPPTTTPTTTAPPASGLPVTITGADGVEVTITDPSRVIPLTGDLVEIAFALGLGDHVVATDVTAVYPEQAAALPKVGHFQSLSAEGILAFGPTVVFGDEQVGPVEVIEQLRGAGVPVVILPAVTTLDGIGDKIRRVAEILGVPEEGETLATSVEDEIARAIALASDAQNMPTVAFLYARGPETLLLAGSGSITQAMIEGAGGVDAGAAAGIRGFAPLTAEALVAAAPEVLVLPTSGLQSIGGVTGLLDIPGVAQTPAAQNERLLSYDDALFLNLGPRTGMALVEFILELHPELVDAG